MTTPAPSFAAISRVVFQPGSVRTTVSVFCFKSPISASCFPGLAFSRLIRMTDSSDMENLLLFRTHQGRLAGQKRIAAWRISSHETRKFLILQGNSFPLRDSACADSGTRSGGLRLSARGDYWTGTTRILLS